MEIKVGDKVKVRNEKFFLNHPNYDEKGNRVTLGSVFVPSMFPYCGETVTIVGKERRSQPTDKCKFRFEIKEDNRSHMWNEYMFESLDNQLELDF